MNVHALTRALPSFPLAALLLLVCTWAGATSVLAQAPDAATALVLRAGPETSLERPGAAALPLATGTVLREGDVLRTGNSPQSVIALVFSNGSNLTVQPNTHLRFEELRQEPFTPTPQTGRYGTLQEEPTTSRTRLKLEEGEVLGEVRGLKRVSVFEVATDVGTAGIRGTVYRVRLEKIGNVWRLSISNADGGVYASSIPLNIPEADVEAENEIVIEADYNSETDTLALVEVTTNPLPPEAVAQILQSARDLSAEAERAAAADSEGTPETPSDDTDDGEGEGDRDESDTFISPS